MTSLSLSKEVEAQLLHWAQQGGAREVCGLLLGADERLRVRDVQLVRNVAANPAVHFELEPAALIAAERAAREGGAAILGYFHSHPNGLAEPSRTDAEHALPDQRIWLIIANGALSAWRAAQNGPHLQRFYPLGLNICEI